MVSRLDVESVRTASLYLAAILRGHLDRGELACRHDANLGYGADGIAFEIDWSTLFEARGILEIGAKDNLSRGRGHPCFCVMRKMRAVKAANATMTRTPTLVVTIGLPAGLAQTPSG